MRIGIFGDSYGANINWEGRTYMDNPWSNRLLTLDPCYSIENNAYIGSSLWYSYKKLASSTGQYDKLIFFITSPNRAYFEKIDVEFLRHHPNFSSIERGLAKDDISSRTRTILSAAREWYIHAKDDELDRFAFQLLINHIVAQYPDALFIKCFNQFNYDVPGWHGPCMYDISKIDETYYKKNHPDKWIDDPLGNSAIDCRSNHMNNDNNTIFAKCIHEWIQTGKFDMSLDKFVTPAEPLDYYFRKRPRG
jgi:hypothetical protein